MNYQLRKAIASEIPQIWAILQQAIERRKKDGSSQWQNGYPNPEVIKEDIKKGVGFVLTDGETILGYSALLLNDEPAYDTIEGKWLTDGDFLVVHRVAISEKHLGKGLAQKMLASIEEFALQSGIYSIKADTNYDNLAMLRVFEKQGYTHCGKVFFWGSPRMAFEKQLPAPG